MLTPNQLDKLPEPVVQLMSKLQDEIISDICRRITKANYLTPTAEWQLYKANQLTISAREVKRRIAAKLKVQESTLKEIYTDAVKTAIREDEVIYKAAIAEGILSDNYREKLTNYTRSKAFSNVLQRGLKNTNGLMRNLTNSAAAAANRQLSDALDLAYLKCASGAFTPQEAIFEAVRKLGLGGLKCVSYESGRTDQLDVAVRRAVVTGIGKTCCDMQLDLAKEMDCELVEVSSHLGARPSHAEWQGQIYSLKKGHPKYPYFYDATGYGTGDGLGGWNCRHSFFPYFEGLSTAANAPTFSKAENLEEYKNTQKQRAYERSIRKSKRELSALDGARSATEDPVLKAKLDREFERKSVTLKNREARLAEHLKATGLLPDNSRVRVDGFGKSVSQKAVWANKNILKYLDNDDIINIKNIMKGYKSYSDKYPDCSFNYYMINYKLKELGIKKGVALPSKYKRAYILPDEKSKNDPYHIMHRMVERNITDDDLEAFMTNAKIMFSQWNGTRQTFYSNSGVVTITKSDKGWIYKTAWTDKDFDEETEKILEVINKYA
ncbi:MAG: phage minor capsid protein [Oscillospiraceae bacterium]